MKIRNKFKNKYKNIIFDCDSTLVKIEGLDEIARRKGLFNRVREVTAAGMNGNLKFSESLKKRLEIIQPDSEDLEWLGQRYVEELIDDAAQVIKKLKGQHLNIFILTGGLLPAVKLLAEHLGIEDEKVFAIDLSLKGTVPFPGAVPMTEANLDTFKIKFIQQIKKTGPTVMVGDGMTDYEAGRFADLFIGFGGIVFRPKLKNLCQIYIQQPRLQRICDIVL